MSARNRCRLAPLLLLGVVCLLAALTTGCNSSGLPGMENDEVENKETRAEYYQQSAKTYFDGGRYAEAVHMWDKVLVETPDDQWAKFGLAKSLQMMGTPQTLRRAEAILKDIICLDWTHPTRGNVRFEVQSTLANTYSSLADFYDRDLRALESRLARDPNADTRTLYQQASCQRETRDKLLCASMPIWNRVLCESPDNPYALAGLAKANLIAGNEDAGIDYAKRYIRVSRESQKRWRRTLTEWQDKMQGNVTADQRAHYLGKIHGARDKEIGVHLLLASVHMRREEFSEAITQYDEVVKMDPALPAAYLERGQAYAALGLYPQAVTDLEQYLKMTDPERQRKARVNAAELLDRYRRLAGRSPLLGPGVGAAPAAAPPAPASPPRPLAPSAQAHGSPDGAPPSR